MKSLKKTFKSILLVTLLSMSLGVFNSCQTSEEEIIFASSELFTKDSKIVPLFLKSVGANVDTNNKSFGDAEQCTEFVYDMTFYAYSSDAEEPSPVIITSDEELVAFLTSLTSGQEFFITYPITLIDVDGNETVITDYPDLEGILTMLVDACIGDDDSDSDDDSDGDDNSDSDDDSDSDGDDDDSDEDGTEYEYCGNNNNKKVVICHNGNTICISINAIWGHMAHHEDDYFGSCNN